jgi:hypothetical protein
MAHGALTMNNRKPVVGPYGRCWRDKTELGARWRVCLTDEGRAQVEAYLAKWPRPAALLKARFYPLYRGLRDSGVSEEEINAVCLGAVVAAFIRYRPGAGAKPSTVVAWAVRGDCQRELEKRVGVIGREWPASNLLSPQTDHDSPAVEPGREDPEPIEPVEPSPGPLFERLPDVLTPGQVKVLTLLYVEDLSYSQAGEVLGRSKELVRQIREAALSQLRRAYGVSTEQERAEWRAILTALSAAQARREELSAAQIALRVKLRKGRVSDHLTHLINERLVERRREGARQIRYALLRGDRGEG